MEKVLLLFCCVVLCCVLGRASLFTATGRGVVKRRVTWIHTSPLSRQQRGLRAPLPQYPPTALFPSKASNCCKLSPVALIKLSSYALQEAFMGKPLSRYGRPSVVTNRRKRDMYHIGIDQQCLSDHPRSFLLKTIIHISFRSNIVFSRS